MAIRLNHLIVPAADKVKSAKFLADILDLEVTDTSPGNAEPGQFAVVRVGDTNLDFAEIGEFESHHYAFLVSEKEFDEILQRLTNAGISYSADPRHGKVGELNSNEGGRGLYFHDPNGHNYELLTQT